LVPGRRPDIFDSDTRTFRTAGAIILMISHGYTVKEHDDPMVDIVEAAMDQFSECIEPGTFLVDMVPLCKSLPSCRLTAGCINRISLSPSDLGAPYSAICARLVPWNGMESESQVVR